MFDKERVKIRNRKLMTINANPAMFLLIVCVRVRENRMDCMGSIAVTALGADRH